MNAKALVLPADENRTDDVAANEYTQTDVVHPVVTLVIVDGKEDETYRTSDCGEGGAEGVDFLPVGGVRSKSALVTKVTLKNEGEIE